MRTIITLIASAIGTVLLAQHTPLTSQYLFNGLLINPAYAGSRDALTLNFTWRQQWVGFQGAPSTQVISVHTPIRSTRMAVGLLIVNDHIGVSRETGMLANFAYRIPFRRGKLQFGLGAGLSVMQSDWSSLAVQDHTDVQFATDSKGVVKPNFSTGVFYYQKLWYVGASMPFVMSHSYDPDRNAWVVGTDRSQYQPMLTGGYVFKMNKDLKFKPTTLIRYQLGSGVQTDVSANLIIKEKLWAGVSYRSNDSVIGMFEVLPTPQWRLGYAYDMGISAISPYHSGTHEVMLQYEFGKHFHVRDPRYF